MRCMVRVDPPYGFQLFQTLMTAQAEMSHIFFRQGVAWYR
jgi:hypothetical protein